MKKLHRKLHKGQKKKPPKFADSANEIDKRPGQCCDNDTEHSVPNLNPICVLADEQQYWVF